MQRTSSLFAVMIITGGLLVSACGSQPAASGSTAPLPVKTFVAGQPLSRETVSGRISPSEEVQVVSKVAGKVAAVRVEEGARVHKGDLLVELDSADYAYQVGQAQAALRASEAKYADVKSGARQQEIEINENAVAQAKSTLDLAQKNYERMKQLYENGAIPQNALEKAQSDLDLAREALNQAQAKLSLTKAGATGNTLNALAADIERQRAVLAQAQNTISGTRVTSPIDGIVVQRNIDPGEMASPGVPLMTVVSMDTVKLEASVPEALVTQLHEGMDVQVQVTALPERIFPAKIAFVSPVADKNTNTFPVKVKIPNKDGKLRAGMIAQLLIGPETQTIDIPVSALLREGNQTFVVKAVNGKAVKSAVTVTPKNSNWVTVQQGVAANDHLILNPSNDLVDGTAVTEQ